jgi:hypothetical protein
MKKKRFFLFLIVILLGFSLAWAGDNPKEKKVYFRFSVGYGLPIGTNSIRPSWNLGYTTFYFGQTGYSYPLDPTMEPWLVKRLYQDMPQKAPAPNDYYWFNLVGEIPDFFLKVGDRVAYNGYSQSQYKGCIPPIQLGIDLKLAKHMFISFDVFACQNKLTVQEEGYILYVKGVWGPYYELMQPDGHYGFTEWYLDTIMEHPTVNMQMKIWNFGITPGLKFEIPIFKGFTILPKVGVALMWTNAKATSDWALDYLYPYDFVFKLIGDELGKPNYFDKTVWQVVQNTTQFAIAPLVGLDFGIGKNFYVSGELQLGTGKDFSVVTADGQGIYKGLLLYNNSNQMRFCEVDPAYEDFRHGNYGTPVKDDFIHLNKVKLLKVSAGFRF